MRVLVRVVFSLFLFQASYSWEVLVANVFSTGSHQTVSAYLANLLTDHGHSVTYVSTNMPSYLRDSIDKRDLPTCTQAMSDLANDRGGEENGGIFAGIRKVLRTIDVLLRACERWYGEPNVRKIVESGDKYDLMISFGLFDSCALGLATHLGINNSIIHMPMPALMPNHVSVLGLPLYSSSVDINDIMIRDHRIVKESAIARAQNLVKRTFFELLYTSLTNWYIEPTLRSIVPNYQGDHSSYQTVKLVTMHSHPHPLIDGPTPFGPGVLTLGGSLCKEYDPTDLTSDLLEFVNSATEGFIYISFGSVQKDCLPEERTKWIETFKDMPYKVV